ncbi:MAG TPA: oligosaccharide flippase family protein, partial [Reyranellaceae bacterium]|nr:oligosaccharide flippase family protein [Reyranellaceae bacterium]
MDSQRLVARLASVPAYFALRVASGLLLLKLSASLLSVSGFTVFAQLILFAAVLNLVAVGGTQNGLIRQSAAAPDAAALARTHSAALLIWAAFAPLLLLPVALAGETISDILVGNPKQWPAVVAIAALAVTAGPGQIWCSILSGRKRVPASLAAQATGLLTSTAAASYFILRGDPVAAAVAFAAGPLVTMTAALLASRLRIGLASPRVAAAEVRPLMRYSAAFAATSGYTAIVLFGLRSVYRDSFGATALGYWMAANRVSDMSTQLLGLFMIQFFVSHFATIDGAADRRRFVLRCWAAGVAAMALALGTFSIAAEPLVRLFLSDAFVPAIPVIRTYMVGDILRVWASLAMFAAFARGHPGRYAAIEIGTLTVLALVASALIAAGDVRAPQLA